MRVENPNKLKPVPDDVNTFLNFPEGWAYPKIGEILTVNYGKGLKENVRVPLDVAVYGSNGIVGQHHIALTKGPTIIIGRKGTVGAVHFSNDACWPIDTTYYIDEFNGLEPKYLLYSLRSLSLTELDTSTAIPGLNRNELYDQHLPLSPLPEQKRIVAKLEGLLTRVNTTKERLAEVSMVLKRFRQAVLAAACSGRLTADWREKQSYIQHAKDLLLSILAERRQFMQESNPKKRGAPESLHPYREAWDVDPSEFEELPDGWVWASGEDLFAWSSGDFLPKKNQEKGPYPIYGGNGITGYHSEYLADHPTLVIGRVGALCGNVYITSDKAWITDNAIYASYVPTKLNLQYVKMVFTQSNLNANAGGSGQPFVNQTVLNKVAFPLPPLAEQDEIVCRVESMFKLADAVEKRVAAATARAEKLSQSIMAKAFRGELVPNEAELARRERSSYESASDLLARIKSAREPKRSPESDNRIWGPQKRLK